MPDQPAFLEDDIEVWDPPVYDAVELSHHKRQDGDLLIYDPARINGERHIRSTQYCDTYDRR